MLKLSYSGADQIQALSQRRFLSPVRNLLARRRSTVVYFSPATKTSPFFFCRVRQGPLRSESVVDRVETSSETLADRLRPGILTEDGLSYKEKFIIRSYEVGINKTATVETIANILQQRLSFPKENNGSLKKIPKLEDPAQYSRLGLLPRRADLDMNQHVNNVTYIGWLLESMPQEMIAMSCKALLWIIDDSTNKM